MAARKTVSPKTPKTPAAQAVEQVVPPAKPIDEVSAWTRYMERLAAAREALFEELGTPDTRRVILAHVAQFAIGAGVGYVGAVVAAYVNLAVLVSTGSAFLAFVSTLLIAFVTVYAGVKLASRVYDAVVDFDSKYIVGTYESTKSRVLGWFERKPAVAA